MGMIESLIAWLIIACTELAKNSPPPQQPPQRVDFAKDVRPIFERKCQPCHFEGGKMYAHLPFDKPETIAKLGTKVFTRIKDQDDRAVIRRFLATR